MAVVLYVFLGWTVWMLWKDLRKQDRRVSSADAPALTLSIPDGELTSLNRFTVSEVTIGRDPACQLVLDERTISARHARLSYHHNQWWVEDLGSRNGSFLNGDPIESPMVIIAGDELRCGNILLNVEIADR
jgi:pSer/pThr/pTyr-binding forkhead associated (FHA) protein